MINPVYYQPWSLMDRWRREIDERFTQSTDASLPTLSDSAAWRPAVDLLEEDGRFILRADVPGVAAGDIEVTADDGTLTVRGERPAKQRVGSDGFEHIERAAVRMRVSPCRIRRRLRRDYGATPMACSRSRFPSCPGPRPSELR